MMPRMIPAASARNKLTRQPLTESRAALRFGVAGLALPGEVPSPPEALGVALIPAGAALAASARR